MFTIIVFPASPGGSGKIIARCRLGSLGNLSTASGLIDPEGTAGPRYSLDSLNLFFL